MARVFRPDRDGKHQGAYKRNRQRIFASQTVCGICGKPVDFSLKSPHPLSACIDHIIPVAKGGHPSDISNMQLAHRTCNRQKSDKLVLPMKTETKVIANRDLPLTFDYLRDPPEPATEKLFLWSLMERDRERK